MAKLKMNHWYKFNDNGTEYVGQYTGSEQGFECCVCGKGCKAHTFNVFYDMDGYETWGYGPNHMPKILADLGESDTAILRKEVA